MKQPSVLVVGAGPTGLTLACDLARHGVRSRIIDKAAEFPVGSRGKGLQPRSLEVLDDLGVVDQILSSGTSHMIFRAYQRDQVIREVDPWAGGTPTPDVPYGSGLIIPQWRVEEVLRGRLAEFGVAVELAAELVEFSQTGDTVFATIRRTDGDERIEATYLVGCDGGRSIVRKSLGVRFDGQTHEAQQMVIGDVEVDGLARDAWHMWFDGEDGLMLCPLPGTRAWQLQAGPLLDEHGHPREPSLEVFQQIFDERAGLPGVRLHNLTWRSTYRTNVRMVDHFRVGRVFLAGDAAHVHSLAGGLGMNTGIQDAYNLAWKLALVLADAAAPGLLDTYEEERLPIAAWTLDTSSESLRMVLEAVREPGGGLDAGLTPETTQLGLGYRWSSLACDLTRRDGRVRAGDRAPDAVCRDGATGTPVRLFDIFRGPHFTLLGFGAGCAGALRSTGVACATGLKNHLVSTAPEADAETLIDDEGHAHRAYGIPDDTLVLVRPDGYIGLTALSHDVAAVRDYLDGLGRHQRPTVR